MDARPEQPPEGALIAAALDRSGMSIREAARRAGISYGRWRQIVNGWISLGKGQYAEVRDAPAKTVARMAEVAGVTPEQLAQAGREDAAAVLRERLDEDRVFEDEQLEAIRDEIHRDPEGAVRRLAEGLAEFLAQSMDPRALAQLTRGIERITRDDDDEPPREAVR